MIAVIVDLDRKLKYVQDGVHLFKTKRRAMQWIKKVFELNKIDVDPGISFQDAFEDWQYSLGSFEYFHFRRVHWHIEKK